MCQIIFYLTQKVGLSRRCDFLGAAIFSALRFSRRCDFLGAAIFSALR
jgi:hypothetical protein